MSHVGEDRLAGSVRYLTALLGDTELTKALDASGLSASELDQLNGFLSVPPADRLRAFAKAARRLMREDCGGRIWSNVILSFEEADPCRELDIPGAMMLLLGEPVRYVDVVGLRDAQIEVTLAVGPGGDCVAFWDLRPRFMPDAAETVWLARDPSVERSDEEMQAEAKKIAEGWRPVDQAVVQNEIDAAVAMAAGETVAEAPPLDEVVRLAQFHRTCTAHRLAGEPGRVDRLRRIEKEIALRPFFARQDGRPFQRTLEFLPDATMAEVLGVADTTLGTDYRVLAPIGVGVGTVVMVRRDGVALVFEPGWNRRKKVPQFCQLSAVPTCPVEGLSRERLDVQAMVARLGGYDCLPTRDQVREAVGSWVPPQAVPDEVRLARRAAKEQAERRNAARRPKLLREHKLKDRSAEWRGITREKLEALVWSKPTSKVAIEVGVSDAMVGRVCDRLGVPKPPRGFWAKVEAGLLPHPQGKPVAA